MGIDVWNRRREDWGKTMQSPRAKSKAWTHLIQSSRSVAYKYRENKRREKDETDEPTTL